MPFLDHLEELDDVDLLKNDEREPERDAERDERIDDAPPELLEMIEERHV